MVLTNATSGSTPAAAAFVLRLFLEIGFIYACTIPRSFNLCLRWLCWWLNGRRTVRWQRQKPYRLLSKVHVCMRRVVVIRNVTQSQVCSWKHRIKVLGVCLCGNRVSIDSKQSTALQRTNWTLRNVGLSDKQFSGCSTHHVSVGYCHCGRPANKVI